MGTVGADWDSDTEGPLQQAEHACVGNAFCRRRDPVSETPCVFYSSCQKHMKEEDVILVQERVTQTKGGPVWSLYCIFDGHSGVAAAQYARNNLWPTLGPMLPTDPNPSYNSPGFQSFALAIRTAVVRAFMSIDQQFKTYLPSTASGTTVTMILLCGRLLTVANVGDSEAALDTGTDSFMLTVNHRIEDNSTERERLLKAGVHLASLGACLSRPAGPHEEGLGPLRCWPGGLAFARSIGDIEAGGHVLSCPHVFQVVLPKSGARVLMGSDGLWDLVPWEDATKIIRWTPAKKAASKIITQALFLNDWSFTDDTTALVVDVLPPDCEDFPGQVKQKLKREQNEKKEKACRWDLRNCFCGSSRNLGESEVEPDCDRVTIVASVDGWELLKQAIEASPNDSCSSLMELTYGLFDECENVAKLQGKQTKSYSQIRRASWETKSSGDEHRYSNCHPSHRSRASSEGRRQGGHRPSHNWRNSFERPSFEEPMSASCMPSPDCRSIHQHYSERRDSGSCDGSCEHRCSHDRHQTVEVRTPVPTPQILTPKQKTPSDYRVPFTTAATGTMLQSHAETVSGDDAPAHSGKAPRAQHSGSSEYFLEMYPEYPNQDLEEVLQTSRETGLHSLSATPSARCAADEREEVSLEAWGDESA